ncbi:hypothetical protein FB451DRAFT_1553825 [Mycena latifolia]|nr:hypothetical protein FB451DRAFT_1553825 [Mycena latifolia]
MVCHQLGCPSPIGITPMRRLLTHTHHTFSHAQIPRGLPRGELLDEAPSICPRFVRSCLLYRHNFDPCVRDAELDARGTET